MATATTGLRRGMTIVLAGGALCGLGIATARGAAPGLSNTDRVLRSAELTGFVTTSPPVVVRGAKAWTRALGEPATLGILTKEGFKQGAFGSYKGPRKLSAYSLLYEFSDAAGARAELARSFKLDPKAAKKQRTVAVPGIPGARGLVEPALSQIEVGWADGRFLYYETVIGPGATTPRYTTALINASRALHQRTSE